MTFKLLLQPLPLLKQMLKHKRAHNNCVVGYAITKGVFLYRRVSGRQFETKRPTYNSLRRQTPWLVAAKLLLQFIIKSHGFFDSVCFNERLQKGVPKTPDGRQKKKSASSQQSTDEARQQQQRQQPTQLTASTSLLVDWVGWWWIT